MRVVTRASQWTRGQNSGEFRRRRAKWLISPRYLAFAVVTTYKASRADVIHGAVTPWYAKATWILQDLVFPLSFLVFFLRASCAAQSRRRRGAVATTRWGGRVDAAGRSRRRRGLLASTPRGGRVDAARRSRRRRKVVVSTPQH